MLLVVFGILSLAFFFLPLKLYSIPETILDSYKLRERELQSPKDLFFKRLHRGITGMRLIFEDKFIANVGSRKNEKKTMADIAESFYFLEFVKNLVLVVKSFKF